MIAAECGLALPVITSRCSLEEDHQFLLEGSLWPQDRDVKRLALVLQDPEHEWTISELADATEAPLTPSPSGPKYHPC